ncbi:MAG: DUF1642 domain-containing protein [Lactococcus lactis]|nr:DUF1642 domain-containing protein [Lactococcus lactis]MDN5438769.1 DUF1642 domain-containing protein [Lactococcus lactis]MDN5947703.1 DUF1642 domain-containing protein [Lactococcus lactis]MDN5950307.1 DUF1642 domain-containing protein [Lactococcus lactis]MDN5960826.1 DUF1642 domain-containing protein [Lactococcus lactis]
MTKFEEEVNKYNIFERTVYLEGGPKKILIDHFKNWHSDEEFQAEKDARKKEYEIHQDIYSKTSKKLNEAELEIANLKSQLQQQSLPVVPEFVAEWIEYVKEDGIFNALALLDKDDMPEGVNEWLFLQSNDDNINLIIRAWLDGYTVEKPQLFYIDLPKVFGLSDSTGDSTFVSKAESGIILEFTKGKDYALKLTEQEIKSIDERYWQFAVPVEDGE